jgi:hypothetical protein
LPPIALKLKLSDDALLKQLKNFCAHPFRIGEEDKRPPSAKPDRRFLYPNRAMQ